MAIRAFLTVEVASSAPRRVGPLTPLTSIGRSATCTVMISDDQRVSKLHAEIRRNAQGGYVLEDRNSSNGTQVAGRDVARHLLGHGDEFLVGAAKFRFEIVADEDHVAAAPSDAARASSIAPAAYPDELTLSNVPVDVSSHAGAAVEDAFRSAEEIADADELRRDYEKLRVAHSILHDICRPMSVERMLHVVARRTFETMPATRFAALLVDDAGALIERLFLDRDGKTPANATPVSRTLLARACADLRPLLLVDVPSMSVVAGAPSVVSGEVTSIVCAPIVEDGELFGALYADTPAAQTPFDEKDLLLLSAISHQLASALRNARLVSQLREEARRRQVLGRFLSPGLVNEVIDGTVSLSRGGETRTVAVLFTDIRGFTSIAERLSAAEVTALLNEHFDVLVDVVFRHGGTLDKYIGDSVMAVFGAPRTGPHDAESAVRCALEMQLAIERLNDARTARGEQRVEIGVGIAHGDASWGPLGSRETMGYTVVGDVVNVASRLCAEAKAGEVLVEAGCRARLPWTMRATKLEKASVKGKAGPVEMWRVERT